MKICINCEECSKNPETKTEGNIEASVFLSMKASRMMAAVLDNEAQHGEPFAVSACEHVCKVLEAAFPLPEAPPKAPEPEETKFVELTLFEFKPEVK